MINLRLLAARVVSEVTEGYSLSDSLKSHLIGIDNSRDRAFVQTVSYGVCRFYSRLRAVLGCLLKKPLKAKDTDVYSLLLVGLYQLMEMRVPDHAAVAETVNATVTLNKSWSRGLINAVLREYLRKRSAILQRIESNEEAYYAHSHWWIKAIKQAWPAHWQAILEENNNHPQFALRVNTRHINREAYLNQLQAKGFKAHCIPVTSSGLVLTTPIPVDDLPGFAAGMVTVQDGAAQLAATLLDLAPGQRILDACSAPGGKLTHLFEVEPQLSLCVAVDKDRERIQLIQDNLLRLKLHAECICQDVSALKAHWDGEGFHRILLDAPCSASGVIRRHPDIKLLKKPLDIKTLAKEQLKLLHAVWPLLKNNGLLLYATCSIFPEENVDVLKAFLAAHSDAMEEKIVADWGMACEFGRQILPGMHQGMDGFYYALLRKNGYDNH